MARIVEDDRVQTPPPYRPERGAQIVTDDAARQGPLGRRNLWIVSMSTIGAFLACGVVYFLYAGMN